MQAANFNKEDLKLLLLTIFSYFNFVKITLTFGKNVLSTLISISGIETNSSELW